jgi:hypothetical protein
MRSFLISFSVSTVLSIYTKLYQALRYVATRFDTRVMSSVHNIHLRRLLSAPLLCT